MVALAEYNWFIPLFSFILFVVIFLRKWLTGPTRKNLPPSPKMLPIIGNLHQIGTLPHRSFQSLSKRYGELILLRFGRKSVLVASSAEAAREIMKKQDIIFANRPKVNIPDRLMYGSTDVAFAPHGEHWRQVKSVCVLHLLSKKRIQSFRTLREEETSAMVEKIKRLECSSSVVNLSDILESLSDDLICKAALGRKYNDYGDFKTCFREFMGVIGVQSLRDYIPWLGWIERVNGLDARVEKVVKQFDEFLENAIQQHRRDAKIYNDGDADLDFVDILLQLQREDKIGDDRTIKAIILDMFAAGSKTTSTSTEWTIAELIRNPRTMKALQDEVRRSKKEIDEEDLEEMPYLKAVIKESLRLHPPLPILLTRESTQDAKVMGYDIPAGTQVLTNNWAIARDPALWENPEEFRPERFLDSDIDFRGLHFELIPFGAGRRVCPGISFGVGVYKLGLAKLVRNFDFELANGGRVEDLDMTEAGDISVHRKHPLLLLTSSSTC